MSVITLAQESARPPIKGFYAPRFEVRVDGADLPGGAIRDISQLSYHDSIQEIDRCDLVVNNWDPTTHAFRYVGAETAASLQQDTEASRRQRLFEPCNKTIQVSLGYSSKLRLLLVGTFTTLEMSYTRGGQPTLNARVLNALHQLRTKQYSHTWWAKRPTEIAQDIARLRDPQTGHARFPVQLATDRQALQWEQPLPYLAQTNQYDIDFLLGLARQHGYVVFLRQTGGTGEQPDKELYFGPSISGVPGPRDVTFRLEWGKSLLDFRPTLSTANQVRAVTVHGWNRRNRQRIAETIHIDDVQANRDLFRLLDCSEREEIVVREAVVRRPKRARARALLEDRVKNIVRASCTTVGVPDLRAGRRVVIAGLGSRLSGTYFVTDTTHTINDSGYLTSFNARRESDATPEAESTP